MSVRGRPDAATLAPRRPGAASARQVAVIDIGSNSVRLVIYRVDGRAMIPAYNEKVMPGLGRDLPNTKALPPAGVDYALGALKRFAAIIGSRDIDRVDVVATAAVRQAEDGLEFAARVKAETGFAVRIIPGAEEARLSALGVLAGAPEANGMVGDLGGSSLELTEITPAGPGRGESLALGPFALMQPAFDRTRVATAIDAALAGAMLARRGGDFYAVGGAWRALGRIHMELHDYPLRVLHHLEMRRGEALETAAFVQKQSKRSLEKTDEAAARRADSMPYAALVLERVLQAGGFERVIISSYGLREGLLYEHLPAAARDVHPLIASAETFADRGAGSRAFGRALAQWIAPVLERQPPVFSPVRDALIREAAARMVDLSGLLHPEQRRDLTFELALLAPLVGVSHRERAFLATAVHHRYTKREPMHPAYARLLDEEERRAALALGAALRLGADLSARSEAFLARFRVDWQKGALTLSAAAGEARFVNEQARRRLDALGGVLSVPVRVAE